MRKIKSKLPENVYKKFYPTGSYPSKFYGNAKVHKLSTNNVDDLTLRTIVSNIGTAKCETYYFNEKVCQQNSVRKC